MQALKKPKNLTLAALLLAISVVLSFLKIPITNIIEVRFNSLPIAMTGYFFGPFVGGIVGMLSDVLGYIVKPTGPFFPGFTVSSALSGVFYGLILYRGRGELSLPKVLVAEAVQTVVISMFLNSLWLSVLYGNGFWVVFSARVIKSLVMYPVNVALLTMVLKPIVRIRSIQPAG